MPFPDLAADSPRPLAFSPDGGLYVSADRLKVEVRDAATGDLRSEFSAKSMSVGLLVSRDGGTVFQRTQDSSIVIYRRYDGVWKTEDLFASKSYSFHIVDVAGTDFPGKSMTATPDGQRVAAIADGSLRVFDTATRRTIAVLPIAEDAATWLALSPDGKSLATGRADGEIVVYDLDKAAVPVANPSNP
jgi:WD40 repeat protein